MDYFYVWVLLVVLGLGVWALSKGNNEAEAKNRDADAQIEALRKELYSEKQHLKSVEAKLSDIEEMYREQKRAAYRYRGAFEYLCRRRNKQRFK